MDNIKKRGLFTLNCQRILIDIPFGIVFVICACFSQIYFLSYISLLGIGIYFLYLVLFRQDFIIKYLFLIFSALTAIIGDAIIELAPQLYLSELQCYSGFVGSLPLLVLSHWVLIVVCLNYDAVYGVETRGLLLDFENKNTKQVLKFFTVIVLILFLALFSKVAAYPAFLMGVDRFEYAAQYTVSGVLLIVDHISTVLIIFPILSVLYGNKLLGSLAIILYALYYLWIGNKFGPFFTLMCMCLLVCYKSILKKGKRFLRKVAGVSCIMFFIIFAYAIIFTTSNSNFDVVSYVMQRGAQQGQLWWKTYDLSVGTTHQAEFEDEFQAIIDNKSIISDNIGSKNGIYRIMYLCAPEHVVDSKLMTGSRYTEAGHATVYYYFGSIGVVFFSVIMGFVFALVINSFLKALNNKDYIKSMIILRFLTFARIGLSMFVFLDFFDFISTVSYLYLLLMWNRKLRVIFENGLQFSLVGYISFSGKTYCMQDNSQLLNCHANIAKCREM
mgnify:CR=1 FL=1